MALALDYQMHEPLPSTTANQYQKEDICHPENGSQDAPPHPPGLPGYRQVIQSLTIGLITQKLGTKENNMKKKKNIFGNHGRSSRVKCSRQALQLGVV